MPENVNKRLLLVRNKARITFSWVDWMVDQTVSRSTASWPKWNWR